MMMAKRTEIDQAMCDHVRILLAGGAKVEQAAEIVGVGESTISRIRRAGFSAEVYMRNKEARRTANKTLTISAEKANIPEEAQVPGQLRMELPMAQQEMSDQTKLMRFQAAQVDKLILKIDRLNDTMSMILRAIRKE